MPRGRHLVRELRGGYQPIGTIEPSKIKIPPKPLDSKQSVLPPAYWNDRQKEKSD